MWFFKKSKSKVKLDVNDSPRFVHAIDEVERVDWSNLRSAYRPQDLRGAIYLLHSAKSEEEANQAYWSIDNEAVVQGTLYEAAEYTIPCLLRILFDCEPVSRPKIFELLFHLGSGAGRAHSTEIELGNTNLTANCADLVKQGLAIYFYYLEVGTDEEQGYCADLLKLCSRKDPLVSERALRVLEDKMQDKNSKSLRKVFKDCISKIKG